MNERLQIILNQLFMNPHSFAIKIGVHKDTMYKKLAGENITPKFKKCLFDALPTLNQQWFETGVGDAWNGPTPDLGQVNEDSGKYFDEKDFIIDHQEKIISQQRLQIEQLLRQIETLQDSLHHR